MHLSLLSDATFSDLLDDAGRHPTDDQRSKTACRQHLEGTLRGLVFIAALLLPFALTFGPAVLEHPRAVATGMLRP